ncbi:5-hydroxyisourate hydrolase-like protein (transthyretin family) [Micromonospora luteifusca]|uniref:5-hydroxyisourate hydrolase-like protein (Transthyretin family) n=1 Tax=Micromonospora luteifusca TaxID=709860 RepID=A0ABS2LV72_9ACTN|nr:carboxypeptidase-like regulatory domain-containing protein [Micromonospora luteifusca]MBM7491539.1 5-hydroxyisourate hydrolase-like protein (transthyretin family) [Micromonospora luteifusca]
MQLITAHRTLLASAVVAALVLPGATPAQAAATGAVGGRLTTSTGAAAAEVQVQVYEADSYNYVDNTSTDADGNYTIAGLPTGSYLVGYFPLEQPGQYYRQHPTIWDANPVTVTAGGTARADDQLFGTGTITGQLVNTAGDPVPDLYIEAREVETDGASGGRTDDQGRFTFTTRPGRYILSFQPIEGSYQVQYVPGKTDRDSATVFEVKADEATVVNETALPVGGLSGRFTTATGAPLADAQVVVSAGNSSGAYTDTDANGEFSVQLLPGSYIVGLYAGDRQQYYRGKLTSEEADHVEVRGGRQTRITDSLLGTGSVTVQAVDSVTGAPIANFCAQSVCSKGTGTVTVTGLPQGGHTIYLDTPDRLHFSRERAGVKVKANRDTKLTVKLRPGAVISTTIVDRQSGAPLADVCLDTFLPKQASLQDGYGDCSDRNGRIQVGPLTAGSYKLFAVPLSDTYGRQWVGANGGTGDEREALAVTATAGQVVTGPQVRLDRAGTVTGTVTDPTGKPVPNAGVSVLTGHPGVGAQDATTDEHGVYTLERLGPYAWPLVVNANPYASVWSGDKTSRFTATPVTVTAGAAATHNVQLDQGVELTGTFRTPDGTPFTSGFVIARSADTGDIAGNGWMTDGQFRMRLKGPQRIFFTYNTSLGEKQFDGRYLVTRPDGTRKLGLFSVPASGSMSVELVVPTR